MFDVSLLTDHWQALAAEARAKGEAGTGPMPPGYWFGMALGLEMAILELKAVMEAAEGGGP